MSSSVAGEDPVNSSFPSVNSSGVRAEDGEGAMRSKKGEVFNEIGERLEWS